MCFDNSWNRGHPINFLLGSKQIIEGIELIVPILSRGEKARIVVPPEVSNIYLPRYFYTLCIVLLN